MGIGLAVVQRIVELHHGSIDLASERGHGCRFTLSLPVAPSKNVETVIIEQEMQAEQAPNSSAHSTVKEGPIRHLSGKA
jgi:nitrogen fixation/metabolism regulation signal transduction histidine kinase